MKTFLITGYEPFAEIKWNPSQLLVEKISQQRLIDPSIRLETRILPVTYEGAVSEVLNLIDETEPDAILSFGLAAGDEEVQIERVAINLKDSPHQDNDDITANGEPIIPGAPLAYFSNLPLSKMHEFLQKKGIPSRISNHAGTYVCNSVFYAAAHEINLKCLKTKYGLIHIPMLDEKRKSKKVLSLETISVGMAGLFNWLVRLG